MLNQGEDNDVEVALLNNSLYEDSEEEVRQNIYFIIKQRTCVWVIVTDRPPEWDLIDRSTEWGLIDRSPE